MNRMIALSATAAASFFLLLPIVACGGATDDASIGKSRNALGGSLKEGDLCDAEKCGMQAGGCATPAGGPEVTPSNFRCEALPQVGSGIGACAWAFDCTAATPTLKEGDVCPAEKCANEPFACASLEGTPMLTPTNIRCVAGPQVGSGVGVCHSVGECVAAP